MALRVYLDNNATTQLDPRIAKIMEEDLLSPPSNPSSLHFFGQQAKNKLVKARESIASYFKVKPHEIIFTASGTESMNFLIRGIASSFTNPHILTSNTEHSCIEKTLLDMQKQGAQVTFLPSGLTGVIPISLIENAIQKDTKLLVFSAVNGETGVKQNLSEISSLSLKYNIPLILDGVALLGKESFEIPAGVVGMGFSAHKFHGPKGVGFVFLRSRTKISPLLTGGGQEYGLRSGTENLSGIIGLAGAISILAEDFKETFAYIEKLRDYFEDTLIQAFPFIQVNGSLNRVCNVSNLAFPGIDAETLLIQLDRHGIAASQGSACSSGALEPSRILTQMGLSPALVKSSIRFTLSKLTTKEEIDYTLNVLANLIPNLIPEFL